MPPLTARMLSAAYDLARVQVARTQGKYLHRIPWEVQARQDVWERMAAILNQQAAVSVPRQETTS